MNYSKQTDGQGRVGIIGGGIAGSTAALLLSQKGVDTYLFEAKDTLVEGPPFCHLHAGGCMYREIAESECFTLLEQSLNIGRIYGATLMRRPTVIAVPQTDPGCPSETLPRLKRVRAYYEELVAKDVRNEVIGKPSDYFKSYSKEELMHLRHQPQPKIPACSDDWMIPFANLVDLESMKYPVILTAEPGWNTMRQAALLNLKLEGESNCRINVETTVQNVETTMDGYRITFKKKGEEQVQTLDVDYVINAAGYQTGQVDDMLHKEARENSCEVKASYTVYWEKGMSFTWPEIVFHGPRNTSDGMAQFTPYTDGVFQLHGMTDSITLFEDGLHFSKKENHVSFPEIPQKHLTRLQDGWEQDALDRRCNNAIIHMARCIPSFASAVPSGVEPMFGVQQIPGTNPDRRAANSALIGKDYARIEIVKATSCIDAAVLIYDHYCAGILDGDESTTEASSSPSRTDGEYQKKSATRSLEMYFPTSITVNEEDLNKLAEAYAVKRGFPKAIANGGI